MTYRRPAPAPKAPPKPASPPSTPRQKPTLIVGTKPAPYRKK